MYKGIWRYLNVYKERYMKVYKGIWNISDKSTSLTLPFLSSLSHPLRPPLLPLLSLSPCPHSLSHFPLRILAEVGDATSSW